jgi:hypothetical protein
LISKVYEAGLGEHMMKFRIYSPFVFLLDSTDFAACLPPRHRIEVLVLITNGRESFGICLVVELISALSFHVVRKELRVEY